MSLKLPLQYINSSNIKNAMVHFRNYGTRSMVRKTLDYLEFTKNYNQWRLSHITTEEELLRQKNTIFPYAPTISIIVPVYKTPELFLRQMIESVTNQTYPNWELCIADGSADSSASYIKDIISGYQKNYPNIRCEYLTENLGISGNTNAALALATGEFIALLDHDDILTPDALYEVVAALNQDSGIDVLYTDEDKVDVELNSYYDPYFKPDFNLDLLRSCNYITHFYVVRKELAQKSGGFSIECNGSQDYDFILKTSDQARKIHHIPKILYHWRIHPASVAGDPESKTYAYDSAVRALQSHLNRCGEMAAASKDAQFGYYKISYQFSGTPLVSIWMDHCSPELANQINHITSYKNYEFVASPEQAAGEYLVCLHHVDEILNSDWLEQFLGNCTRTSVGIAGAKILYKKDRILEYGLIYTADGQVHSPFYKFYTSDTGYCYRARIQQNCSLIGPHCFMVKTDLFHSEFHYSPETSLMEQVFAFCQKLTEKRLSVVLVPYISARCSKAAPKLLSLPFCNGKGDPFYNPNFSQKEMYHLSKQ